MALTADFPQGYHLPYCTVAPSISSGIKEEAMARPRSAFVDLLVYVAVRGLVCVVQTLTWDVAYALGDALAWLAFRVDRRHRDVALDNLRHAFPDAAEAERVRTVRETYRHFCGMVVEIIRGPRTLTRKNLDAYFHYESVPQRLRIA